MHLNALASFTDAAQMSSHTSAVHMFCPECCCAHNATCENSRYRLRCEGCLCGTVLKDPQIKHVKHMPWATCLTPDRKACQQHATQMLPDHVLSLRHAMSAPLLML